MDEHNEEQLDRALGRTEELRLADWVIDAAIEEALIRRAERKRNEH